MVSPAISCIPGAADLEALEDEDLRQAVLGASVAMVQGRLLLGRCLLEIVRRDLLACWGYSGLNHFAALYLRVHPREAKEARRVARPLECLPLLTQAAEAGQVRWCNLREVVRVAEPETEAEWLYAAATRPYRALRRLVRRALDGAPPSELLVEDPQASFRTRFEMDLIPEEAELQQAAISILSAQAGRPLSPREAHMEMYRMVAEGLIRTSARKVKRTRKLVEELVDLREEQDAREAEAIQAEARSAQVAEGGHTRDRSLAGVQQIDVAETGSAPEGVPEGHTCDPYTEPAHGRVAASAEAGGHTFVPSPTDAYEIRPGHSLAREGNLPDLPWAAALVQEGPCPDNPDLLVASAPRKRTIREQIRQYVLRRDGYQCACPDCTNTIWLDLHHLVFWCRGGLNVPSNLIVLCRKCHANLHKGYLRISGTPATGLVFTDRRGRILGQATPEEERRAAESAAEILHGAVTV